MGGYADLLAVHSAAGWWGGEASAPQGLGWATNQLAAFPSMHAGWALWVALAVAHVSQRRALVGIAWAHAVVTGIVIVGTGNHWLLDVVGGWAVVLIAWRTLGPDRDTDADAFRDATAGAAVRETSLSPPPAAPAPCVPAPRRSSSTSAAARP